jgi:protein KTI12
MQISLKKKFIFIESQSEKPARGALFTAVQRHLASDTILVVDGMNYIKGFRYQLYCTAREKKLRFCTVQYMFIFHHYLYLKFQ